MQEEIERKTVCLVFKGAKLTTEMLAAGIKKALDTGLNTPHKEHEKHGEMKLKDFGCFATPNIPILMFGS